MYVTAVRQREHVECGGVGRHQRFNLDVTFHLTCFVHRCTLPYTHNVAPNGLAVGNGGTATPNIGVRRLIGKREGSGTDLTVWPTC
jgi:hypothetical protein